MSTSPSAVVTAQVDAFNARDLDAFCATYAPDAVVSGVTPEPIVGRDALRAFYAGRFEDPALHCVIDASSSTIRSVPNCGLSPFGRK